MSGERQGDVSRQIRPTRSAGGHGGSAAGEVVGRNLADVPQVVRRDSNALNTETDPNTETMSTQLLAGPGVRGTRVSNGKVSRVTEPKRMGPDGAERGIPTEVGGDLGHLVATGEYTEGAFAALLVSDPLQAKGRAAGSGGAVQQIPDRSLAPGSNASSPGGGQEANERPAPTGGAFVLDRVQRVAYREIVPAGTEGARLVDPTLGVWIKDTIREVDLGESHRVEIKEGQTLQSALDELRGKAQAQLAALDAEVEKRVFRAVQAPGVASGRPTAPGVQTAVVDVGPVGGASAIRARTDPTTAFALGLGRFGSYVSIGARGLQNVYQGANVPDEFRPQPTQIREPSGSDLATEARGPSADDRPNGWTALRANHPKAALLLTDAGLASFRDVVTAHPPDHAAALVPELDDEGQTGQRLAALPADVVVATHVLLRSGKGWHNYRIALDVREPVVFGTIGATSRVETAGAISETNPGSGGAGGAFDNPGDLQQNARGGFTSSSQSQASSGIQTVQRDATYDDSPLPYSQYTQPDFSNGRTLLLHGVMAPRHGWRLEDDPRPNGVHAAGRGQVTGEEDYWGPLVALNVDEIMSTAKEGTPAPIVTNITNINNTTFITNVFITNVFPPGGEDEEDEEDEDPPDGEQERESGAPTVCPMGGGTILPTPVTPLDPNKPLPPRTGIPEQPGANRRGLFDPDGAPAHQPANDLAQALQNPHIPAEVGLLVPEIGRTVPLTKSAGGQPVGPVEVMGIVDSLRPRGGFRMPPFGRPGAPAALPDQVALLQHQVEGIHDIVDGAFIGNRFSHYAGNIAVQNTNQAGLGLSKNYVGAHWVDPADGQSIPPGLDVEQIIEGDAVAVEANRPAVEVRARMIGQATSAQPVQQIKKVVHDDPLAHTGPYLRGVVASAGTRTTEVELAAGYVGLKPAALPVPATGGTLAYLAIDASNDAYLVKPDGTQSRLNDQVGAGGMGSSPLWGDGSDGAYAPSSSANATAGAKNYTSVTIPTGVVISAPADGSPLIWRIQGDLTLEGTAQINAVGYGGAPSSGSAGGDGNGTAPGNGTGGVSEPGTGTTGGEGAGGGSGVEGSGDPGSSANAGSGGGAGGRGIWDPTAGKGASETGGSGGAGVSNASGNAGTIGGTPGSLTSGDRNVILAALAALGLPFQVTHGGGGGAGGGGGSGARNDNGPSNTGGAAGTGSAIGSSAGASGTTVATTGVGNACGGGGGGEGGWGGGVILLYVGGAVRIAAGAKITADGAGGGQGGDGGSDSVVGGDGGGAGGGGGGGGGGAVGLAYGDPAGESTNVDGSHVTATGGAGGGGGNGGTATGTASVGGNGGQGGSGESGYVSMQKLLASA